MESKKSARLKKHNVPIILHMYKHGALIAAEGQIWSHIVH